MSFNQNLTSMRKARNISQEELAEKLSISRQTLSKWETNQSSPDINTLEKICEIFNVTPNEIIYDIKDEKTKVKDNSREIVFSLFAVGILGAILMAICLKYQAVVIDILGLVLVSVSAVLLLIFAFIKLFKKHKH